VSHPRCKPGLARGHPQVRGWQQATLEVAGANSLGGSKATPGLWVGHATTSFIIIFIIFLILRVLYVNFDYKIRVFELFQVF